MKACGYLVSILSVLMLGWVAWPKPGEPVFKAAVLIGGMLASVSGMLLRYLSHRKERAAIAYARQEAERNAAPLRK